MPQGPAKFQAQLDGLFSSQTNFQRLLLIATALSSNNTVDEGFPPMEFSVDKYFYFYHKLVSNYCIPIFRATYWIFYIHLQLGS